MPVHIEELRALLRLEGDGDDALLHALLAAAVGQAEVFCRRALAGGPAAADGEPEALRLAVLRLAAAHYAARDGDAPAMPEGVAAMLRPFRRVSLMGTGVADG